MCVCAQGHILFQQCDLTWKTIISFFLTWGMCMDVPHLRTQVRFFRTSSSYSARCDRSLDLAPAWQDPNDGKEGFGIMTNEPPYSWQVEAASCPILPATFFWGGMGWGCADFCSNGPGGRSNRKWCIKYITKKGEVPSKPMEFQYMFHILRQFLGPLLWGNFIKTKNQHIVNSM